MGAALERPHIRQFGTEVPFAEGFRLMAKATAEASPLLAYISEQIAEDEDVLGLMTSLAPGQLPTQIHCVVSYLLASSPQEPLRQYFPCYAEGAPRAMEGVYPVFREFCLRREAEIRPLLSSRTMQLTFPERAAPILVALERVAVAGGEPISLIEVGCSAGLLLHVDRYRYDFGKHGIFGDANSPVTVKTDLLGAEAAPPVCMPKIGARLGIDLHPINPADPDEVEWILAALGPERLETRDSTEKSLALAAAMPIDIVKGDALKVLPEAAAAMSGTLCVVNSHCMYQWPQHVCDAFEALLGELSRSRDVHRISIESRDRGPADIMHLVYRGGKMVDSVSIAGADKFGRWIDFDLC